ncbi:MAG: transposase [Pseudomonadota bacterium]
MSNYRRVVVPGGTYFFTLVTHERLPLFTSAENVSHLRAAFHKVRDTRPYVMDAIVVLPDHLHCIWRLPEGDGDFSSRWREIKKATSRAIASTADQRHERSVWQRRFWEHLIRDEEDWRRYLDYIHYNPVKHGLAKHPYDWPWSSFRRCVERGWYEASWGAAEPIGIGGLDLE